jgi:hypothetical protein
VGEIDRSLLNSAGSAAAALKEPQAYGLEVTTGGKLQSN